ncbi:MAG: endonuclease/exonuclease/phosphatase family protein [Desulfobacterales bacterium]|jgi:maltose 6'-phosphate phosphatase|nr:endonuclease/exonuclease/phosphatase family protein [Desulfobacterales bacterium]
MNRFGEMITSSLSVFVFLMLPLFGSHPGKGVAQETGPAKIKSVKFMTINLLFSEVDDRNKRLRRIADYVADNNVDVLLLQEVVGGELVNTRNSAVDLRDILRDEHRLKYFSRSAFETGVPDLLSLANAILSRFDIEFSDDHGLPGVTEEKFMGFDVKLARRVLMTRLLVPGFGEVDVFNTHLCARCSLDDREDQLDVVFDFLNKFRKKTGPPRPTVLGGDMNFDLFDNDGNERFLYERVLAEGFSDAYADYVIAAAGAKETLETLCEDEKNADEHCTVGVSDLNGSNARRIDYIYAQGFGPPLHSQAVFNPNAPNGVSPTVSDHAAVVVTLKLPFKGTLPNVPLLLLDDKQN